MMFRGCLAIAIAAVVLGGSAAAQTLPPSGEGRRLWLKLNCYGCHGMYGGGAMGPMVRGLTSADQIGQAVLLGEAKGMLSYRGRVRPIDVENIVAYIRSLGGPDEPVFNRWWEPVPSQ